MVATVPAQATYRRAVVLMTVTSFLVPLAGLVTAPILARALDVSGRGELAAAIAPAGLMLAAATMGLPDAVTYFVAKRPDAVRRALTWSGMITGALALACVVIVFFSLPFLRGGNTHLGHLILLAAALTVPALTVGVIRGAAIGSQMWRAVAVERLILTGGRVIGFSTLYALHRLTVTSAVLVNVVLPIIAGTAYLGLRSRPAAAGGPELSARDLPDLEHGPFEFDEAVSDPPVGEETQGELTLRLMVSFGTRVWFGSVASMVLDRAAPLLMVPLSDAANLGLYTVANTVSDLPLVVALAIAGALFGANAKSANADQVTSTSRLSLLVCGAGCIVLVGTMHWWIGPIFGPDFDGAVLPTVILTMGSIIVIPGVMAGAALSAWGRPGLRSAALAITLSCSLPLFFLLVPPYGVYGAAWTELICSCVMTAFMVGSCTRVIGIRPTLFFAIRFSDVLRLFREGERGRQMVAARLPRNGRKSRALVDST